MATLSEKAEAFRRLHHGDRPLILPNAWDVPSARVFEDAGFPAVATSSAGICVSLGYPDGEGIPRREMVAAVARIASRLAVPLSADVVAGFGRGPRGVVATVKQFVSAGAVGINLEDYDAARSRLFPISAQARKIRATVELGRALGVPLVINARTDALWKGSGSPEALLREAIRRGIAYRDAGADCVYPMRLTDAESIRTFVGEVACPVNVMVRPGLPTLPELTELGVQRISFGPGASYAAMGLLRRIGAEVRSEGSFRQLLEGAISFDELNQLASARPVPPP